eukprot:1146265-Prymnesium_polylepis.1
MDLDGHKARRTGHDAAQIYPPRASTPPQTRAVSEHGRAGGRDTKHERTARARTAQRAQPAAAQTTSHCEHTTVPRGSLDP